MECESLEEEGGLQCRLAMPLHSYLHLYVYICTGRLHFRGLLDAPCGIREENIMSEPGFSGMACLQREEGGIHTMIAC